MTGVLAVFVGALCRQRVLSILSHAEPGHPGLQHRAQARRRRRRCPLHDKPGHYSVIVEGHFLPVEGQQNRTAAYNIALGHDGATDRVLAGAFNQEWRSQRIGAGRRSSLVPSLHQTTEVRDVIDDPDGPRSDA